MTIHSRESTADGGKQVPDYNLPPRVLIVGAGLAGLLLAILLEHSHTPYKIFERAAEVKPIGNTAPEGWLFERCRHHSTH